MLVAGWLVVNSFFYSYKNYYYQSYSYRQTIFKVPVFSNITQNKVQWTINYCLSQQGNHVSSLFNVC